MKKITAKFKEFGHVIVDPVLYLAVVGIVLAISTLFTLTKTGFLNNLGTILNAATNSAIIGNLSLILCVGLCGGFARKQKANASIFALLTYLMFLYANNAFHAVRKTCCGWRGRYGSFRNRAGNGSWRSGHGCECLWRYHRRMSCGVYLE